MRTSSSRPSAEARVRRSLRCTKAVLVLTSATLASHVAHAAAITGSVIAVDTRHAIPYTYVAIADPSFAIVAQGSTDTRGAFALDAQTPVFKGFVIVQPPAPETATGLGIYLNTPRIYAYNGEQRLDIALPPAACIVLRAYDAQGLLMRWEDFRKRGTFGDQFMYATDSNDIAMEATCWPVFDADARSQGQPREKGLPALLVAPGSVCVPQVLFWETRGYGKLQLRADNDGDGFSTPTPGKPRVLELNVELARTAVHDLDRRGFTEKVAALKSALTQALTQKSEPARAAAADEVLANALRMRDELELERAHATIHEMKQPREDFSFGVFEGSPYNAKAFKLARDAGFDLATVLLGWGWTDANGGKIDAAAIETTFGIAQLRQQGYRVKAHGVVWLQDYGILPERARGLPPTALRDAMLAQETALLDALAPSFSVWEVMNEPNVTNVLKMPREDIAQLLGASAKLIKSKDNLTSLINSAHEGDYGRRFAVYALDNTPGDDWNRTYLDYLVTAQRNGALDAVDVIGLQYYPGFHFNESFGGLQGPATTPSSFIDTIERYTALKRPIHITECSIPSTYNSDWMSGYWREPWTEQTQADYAEMIFTFAYANTNVQSISWWDVLDTKSSVTTGGLCDATGKPKAIVERLKALIELFRNGTPTQPTPQASK